MADENISCIFIEESNDKSLEVLEKCVASNKNIMMDKPAGDNYDKFK